jgi:outer membrane protein TolC
LKKNKKTMKYSYLTILLVISISSFSQQIDYNKIILPSGASDVAIEEKLVRLAWMNSPSSEIHSRNIAIAKTQISLNNWSWLNNFLFQANANEFNIDPSRDIAGRSQFYPRYNFSFNLRFGQFIDIPLQSKINRNNLIIQEMTMNEKKLEVRAEVLRLYEIYKSALEFVNIQNEILEDSKSAFSYFEGQFKNGEMSFEAYNEERIINNRNRLNILNARRELEIAKINLERTIGVQLEEALD